MNKLKSLINKVITNSVKVISLIIGVAVLLLIIAATIAVAAPIILVGVALLAVVTLASKIIFPIFLKFGMKSFDKKMKEKEKDFSNFKEKSTKIAKHISNDGIESKIEIEELVPIDTESIIYELNAKSLRKLEEIEFKIARETNKENLQILKNQLIHSQFQLQDHIPKQAVAHKEAVQKVKELIR